MINTSPYVPTCQWTRIFSARIHKNINVYKRSTISSYIHANATRTRQEGNSHFPKSNCQEGMTSSLEELLRLMDTSRKRTRFSFRRQHTYTHAHTCHIRRTCSWSYSFNLYVMHQCQRLSYPAKLPLLLLRQWKLLRPFSPDGPASLSACHPNNGIHQGLTTRFSIHQWPPCSPLTRHS